MLTGKDTIKEKQEGFETGADDYLTKPFNMQELTMRLMALLRRPATYRSKVLQCRDIVVDTGSRKVTKGTVVVRLFPKDYLLLEFLMLHPNEIFSTEAILDRVWDSGSESSEDAVITSVKRLRKQLDDDGATSIISTIRGAGYRLNSD
jgi:DNA-binding response OmpR family regulator